MPYFKLHKLITLNESFIHCFIDLGFEIFIKKKLSLNPLLVVGIDLKQSKFMLDEKINKKQPILLSVSKKLSSNQNTYQCNNFFNESLSILELPKKKLINFQNKKIDIFKNLAL